MLGRPDDLSGWAAEPCRHANVVVLKPQCVMAFGKQQRAVWAVDHIAHRLIGGGSPKRLTRLTVEPHAVTGTVSEGDLHRAFGFAVQVHEAGAKGILRFRQHGSPEFAPLFVNQIQCIWVKGQHQVALVLNQGQGFSVQGMRPEVAGRVHRLTLASSHRCPRRAVMQIVDVQRGKPSHAQLVIHPRGDQPRSDHNAVREGHGKRAHRLADVLAFVISVEHLAVPSDQKEAVVVGPNPRGRKRTVLHGDASAPLLMDLRHKAGLGEPCGRGMGPVVLVVACDGDEASTSMLNALLKRGVFVAGKTVESSPTYTKGRVRVWCRSGIHLDQDHLDRRWTASTGEAVEDVLFLSKHAAASGRPCLTVHPIGVPHLEPGTSPPYGGKAGEAPPPSPRLAPFWRALQRRADDVRIPEFEVSLEVTHHGPWQHAPAAFLEVGSTKATWAHEGAAEVWADVLLDVLRCELLDEQTPPEPMHVPVLITLGGGHYAPRANTMAGMRGALLGHMLANHSLPFARGEDGSVTGRWSQAVDVAIEATMAAHHGRTAVISLDKKSFRGWERRALFDHLETRGVDVVDSATHASMLREP